MAGKKLSWLERAEFWFKSRALHARVMAEFENESPGLLFGDFEQFSELWDIQYSQRYIELCKKAGIPEKYWREKPTKSYTR